MSTPGDLTRGFSDQHRAKFFAYLDRLPAKDRPVFGFPAQRPSLWQRLGGGTTYVLVLFFPDHVVFSKRVMASSRESARTTRLLGEIGSIGVSRGTLASSVTIAFVDAERMRLANVGHAAADALSRFEGAGLAAFERAGLAPDAVRGFFIACSQVLPLPDGLFTELE
jgi:hypothetical protein